MKTGKDVAIYSQAKILNPENFEAGNSVIIDDFVFLQAGSRMTLGSFIHIGAFTSVAGGGEFIMEDFAGLSGGVRVYTGNEDYLGGCLTNPAVPSPWRKAVRSFVHIGKHAIIGANTVILPGVKIGEGAVVGACSLVKSDLEPWTIYVGTPAKAVAKRKREKMLELEADLRRTIFDSRGRYIPKAERK